MNQADAAIALLRDLARLSGRPDLIYETNVGGLRYICLPNYVLPLSYFSSPPYPGARKAMYSGIYAGVQQILEEEQLSHLVQGLGAQGHYIYSAVVGEAMASTDPEPAIALTKAYLIYLKQFKSAPSRSKRSTRKQPR